MAYRDDDSEPLIIIGSRGIQALDPRTGAQLWRNVWPHTTGYNRVASYSGVVALANGPALVFFERRTGRMLAEQTLPFHIMTLLVRDGALFAAGVGGIACFHGSSLAWRIERRDESSWLNSAVSWVHVAGGLERPLEGFSGEGSSSDLALVFGDDVAQADRDT